MLYKFNPNFINILEKCIHDKNLLQNELLHTEKYTIDYILSIVLKLSEITNKFKYKLPYILVNFMTKYSNMPLELSKIRLYIEKQIVKVIDNTFLTKNYLIINNDEYKSITQLTIIL
jgi:hypothetical protein